MRRARPDGRFVCLPLPRRHISVEKPASNCCVDTVIRSKKFTNGADATTVIDLYAETNKALLGTLEKLTYKNLEWSADEYARLGLSAAQMQKWLKAGHMQQGK